MTTLAAVAGIDALEDLTAELAAAATAVEAARWHPDPAKLMIRRHREFEALVWMLLDAIRQLSPDQHIALCAALTYPGHHTE